MSRKTCLVLNFWISHSALRLLAWLVTIILTCFTIRRWLFMIVALRSSRQTHTPQSYADSFPSLLLLVPVRNEMENLPDFLPALEQLIYPRQKLVVVFIDDGSTDGSASFLKGWVKRHPTWHLITLAQNLGKADALNAALHQFPQGQLVAVYDVDDQPAPDALRHLVAPFDDRQVGAVSGRRVVGNSLTSVAASYTTFEGLVHQLVTMQAKDSLELAPALLGSNCVYRRTALAAVGYFKSGALLEDSDLTLKLARAGWRTRFTPQAVSYHQVPYTVAGYWRQHTRWARGFHDVLGDQLSGLLLDRRLSLSLRVELLMFSLGYLDRLALITGVGLALAKKRGVRWTVALSLLTPCLQVMAALKLSAAPLALWQRIGVLPLFFGLDIAMAVAGLLKSVTRSPRTWEARTEAKM